MKQDIQNKTGENSMYRKSKNHKVQNKFNDFHQKHKN